MVEEDTHWCVMSFCYLEYALCGTDQVYSSFVRSSIMYESETFPLLADAGLKFERADIQVSPLKTERLVKN